MIINNKVYDLTSYVASHPGGTGSILSVCGKDATTMYANIGHSDYAKSLLSKYYIGNYINSNSDNHHNDDNEESENHSSQDERDD